MHHLIIILALLLAAPSFAHDDDCATALVRIAAHNPEVASFVASRCESQGCALSVVSETDALLHFENAASFNSTLGACAQQGTCEVLGVVEAAGGAAGTGTANANPTTQATVWHGLPGNNPAHGGSSANPNGGGVNGGNGIHDIDENPGQSGVSPADFDTGTVACELHGGMDGVKRPCQ